MAAALQGTLLRYGPSPSHLAFIASSSHATASGDELQQRAQEGGPRFLALVAGLTEGMLSLGYSVPLADALQEVGWTLVLVQLSSSYMGYGVGSLDKDAEELLQLSRTLSSDYEASGLVIMGHSTGCQDAVRFMQRHATAGGATPLLGTILQVSDREWLSKHPELQPVLQQAQHMVFEGLGEEVVTRFSVSEDRAPVCARRLVSWMVPGGDDDHFSSDLCDDELKVILRPVGQRPCLLLVSGADETVLPSVDVQTHAQRLASAVGSGTQLVVLPGAPHALDGHEKSAIEHVIRFLEGL